MTDILQRARELLREWLADDEPMAATRAFLDETECWVSPESGEHLLDSFERERALWRAALLKDSSALTKLVGLGVLEHDDRHYDAFAEERKLWRVLCNALAFPDDYAPLRVKEVRDRLRALGVLEETT
jgi:hypothetical protein